MSEESDGPGPIDYFVICSAADIDVGEAKAFDLAQADGEGGGKPFRILVAHNGRGEFFAYRNSCPHEGVWLNVGSGAFLDETGALLRCGRHGAKFEIESGKCVSGACEGARLEQVSWPCSTAMSACMAWLSSKRTGCAGMRTTWTRPWKSRLVRVEHDR